MIENLRVIACAPTGSGKSKMMASIATKAILPRRDGHTKSVLIITEAKKIYDQLEQELPIVNIKAGIKDVHVERGVVYLAMAQTLSRRKHIISKFKNLGYDLIVMTDEAHIGTSTKLLLNFVDFCYMIGWTATPDWKAAKHLPILYNACVQACDVDDLIQDGFLCTYKHFARDKAELDILEMRGADFSEESQEKAFGTDRVYDGLIEDLSNRDFKKCMVFCASIKSAEQTYQRLIENGFKACRYHSGNEDFPLKNPDYELAKFMELNLCNICVSVASLTKGFDYPPTDLICLLRKTNSLPLYLQMMGRASRPIKYEDLRKWIFTMTEPKISFTVLDYGSHWKTLGYYWDNRDWETMWLPPLNKKKKKEGEGVANVKMCENCDELIPAQSRMCPCCGYEYPIVEKELEQGDLLEVTAHYTDLIGMATSELSPLQLSVYAKMKNKRPHAIRIAMYQELNGQPSFIRQFAGHMGFQRDWIDATEREAKTRVIKSFNDVTLR